MAQLPTCIRHVARKHKHALLVGFNAAHMHARADAAVCADSAWVLP